MYCTNKYYKDQPGGAETDKISVEVVSVVSDRTSPVRDSDSTYPPITPAVAVLFPLTVCTLGAHSARTVSV